MSEQQPPGHEPPPGYPPPPQQQPYGGGQYAGAPQGGQPYSGGPAQRPSGSTDLSPADQRLWATLTHLGGIFLYVVAPLVAYLVLRDRGLFVRDQTREALNFQITTIIVWAVVGFLSLISFGLLSFLLLVVPVYVAILSIIAAVKANNGERYRYPLTLRLVR